MGFLFVLNFFSSILVLAETVSAKTATKKEKGTGAGRLNTDPVARAAQWKKQGHDFFSVYTQDVLNAALGRQKNRSFVSKSTYSNKRRLLFIAGVEGTGHHFWLDMLNKCKNGKKGCRCPDALGESLFNRASEKCGLFLEEKKLLHKGKNWTMPTGRTTQSWLDGKRKSTEEVKRQLLNLKGLEEGVVYIHETMKTGALSYPNFMNSYPEEKGGATRIFQYPDVRVLAELCEQAKVDLRVLVLSRDAYGLLSSTAMKRSFGDWDSQYHILQHNAKVLSAQLSLIDKKFIICSKYEDLPELPKGLNDFVRPKTSKLDFAAGVKKEFRPSAGMDVPLEEEDAELTRKLQVTVEKFDNLHGCGLNLV